MFQEEKFVKKRKLCENQESMEDMISKLPEGLICCHILSRLRTVDAVKTSILSTRWRNLWKSVPDLALHSRKFSTGNDFVTFINKFLYFHKDSLIRKFQLRIYDCHFNDKWLDALYMDDYVCYVTKWIDDVLTLHKIQHLDFSFGNSACYWIGIPLSLYVCKTLVHLRLVGIRAMLDSVFVSLPCLKSIYLRDVRWPNVTIFEKFISNSPVLEDLTIIGSCIHNVVAKPLRLQSQTLERIYVDSLRYGLQGVLIDAPRLQCLKIKLILYDMSRTIYSGFSPKVQVHVTMICKKFHLKSNINAIRDFLTNISIMVNDLLITKDALKYIYRFSNLEPLPQFGYMSCLNVNLCVSMLKWFPTFLESCPNLKSLSMEWHANSKEKKKYIRFEYVPECLLSSLECVDIKTMVSEDAIEVKVVKYFLDNAVILKKLTLKLNSHPRKKDIFEKILNFPRRSIASQLLLL